MGSSNRGTAYLWVVTLTIILLLLAGLFLNLTTTDLKIVSSLTDGIRAYYLAECGLSYAINMIYSRLCNLGEWADLPSVEQLDGDVDGDGINDLLRLHTNPLRPEYSIEHSYQVSVSFDGKRYILTATGKYGRATKKLEAVVEVKYNDSNGFPTGAPQVIVSGWHRQL